MRKDTDNLMRQVKSLWIFLKLEKVKVQTNEYNDYISYWIEIPE